MKVIILSAGHGRRLLPLTQNIPKCAVKVAGVPILEWQLREIAKCPAIDEVVVVSGYGPDKVESIVGGFGQGNLRVRSLYNPFYSSSDNLGTCWIVRHEMNAPFVLINGDTLFEAAVLEKLVSGRQKKPITLTLDRKTAYDHDDMKVILVGNRVLNVGKKLDLRRVNAESIGVTRFSAEGATLFCTELERSMRSGEGLTRWYLSAIDAIAQTTPVGACLVEGLSWCEVDTLEDVEQAHRILSDWISADVAPGRVVATA